MVDYSPLWDTMRKRGITQYMILQALSIYFKEISVSGKNPVVYNMKNYIHCDHECITDRRIICVKN